MQNALRFLMKKTSFFSIDKYFFFYFFKGSKVISQRDKKNFFHQKSEGILHLHFAGIACKIHQGILEIRFALTLF